MNEGIKVHRTRTRKSHSVKLRRVALWGAGITLFLMVVVAITASAIRKQMHDEEIRQQERDQNRIDERYAMALRLQAPCRKAIEQLIYPVRVLNWQTTSSPLNDWKDIESFTDTTTGHKMKLSADIGSRYLSYVCYLDKSAQVIQLVEGGY